MKREEEHDHEAHSDFSGGHLRLDVGVRETICPIIAGGDAIGAVILFSRDPKVKMGDMELKLALTAANFLGRQMENETIYV